MSKKKWNLFKTISNMEKYGLPLEEGAFYHIYNQGNNRENIFYNDGNYVYFLQKLDFYLSDFIEMYAFCLMPNHFHLLVRIKIIDELNEIAMDKFVEYKASKANRHSKFRKLGMSISLGSFPISEKLNDLTNSEIYSDFISEQFRRFFMSYSKSINKQEGRVGSLFRKNFKRKEITSLEYLQTTVVYIHRNPAHHDFVTDFTTYRWSSYNYIINKKNTKLKKFEVLEWFGDKENYCYVHCCEINDDIE